MDIGDLTDEERIALVSLLREVIQADDVYSDAERRGIRALRKEMGEAVFDDAVAEAADRFRSRADVKAHAKSITRPEARRLIYERLLEVADSDGLVPAEEKPLVWLASWWDIKG